MTVKSILPRFSCQSYIPLHYQALSNKRKDKNKGGVKILSEKALYTNLDDSREGVNASAFDCCFTIFTTGDSILCHLRFNRTSDSAHTRYNLYHIYAWQSDLRHVLSCWWLNGSQLSTNDAQNIPNLERCPEMPSRWKPSAALCLPKLKYSIWSIE